MEICSKATFRMERAMEEVELSIKTVHTMMVNGKMIRKTVSVSMISMMALSMKVTGTVINNMATEN